MSEQYLPSQTNAQFLKTLAQHLAEGRSDTLARLFAQNNAPAPQVVWQPSLVDAQHPILRSFLRGVSAADPPINVRWLDSEEFGALNEWTMVVAPTDDGNDFYYRHYGAKIAEVYQADMTGRRVSHIGGHVSVFFSALYRAVTLRNEPVLSVHEPPRMVFVRAWRRIIQPLIDDDGAITCFAAVNVPDNDLRAGLEVLSQAVMVVSPEGAVQYANRAACLLFGQARSPLGGADLASFAGIEIDLPSSPDRLILQGGQRETRGVIRHGSMLVPIVLTIGATYYRDLPLFVISARLENG